MKLIQLVEENVPVSKVSSAADRRNLYVSHECITLVKVYVTFPVLYILSVLHTPIFMVLGRRDTQRIDLSDKATHD